MEPFPGNSAKTRAADRDPKRVERVTSSAVRRRKPLGKQFKHTFFGGDARSAIEYMIAEVLVPAAKEAIVDAMSSGFEKLVYGESRRKRGPGPMAGALGYVSYNRQGAQRGPATVEPQRMSRQARARHAFDEIVIGSRTEAEEVLDRMYDLLSRYDSVAVADLYDLTGIESSHTDHKWGWRELHGSGVGRVRGGGYVLDLPEPEPLG
jgi:hypothetical protein